MPSAQSFRDYFEVLHERILRRADARELAGSVLPPDFTGQVFNRAREEAARIRARIAVLDAAIGECRQELAAAEKQVRALQPIILSAPRRRGDILGEFAIEPGKATGGRIRSQEALEARQKLVEPLRRRLQALERERWLRGQELGQLRRIAGAAGSGEVALIHHLSDAWRSRLEIGPATLGKLPKPARALLGGNTLYVDSAGRPLPPEALDEEGKPDMPPRGRVSK